jgi:tRNA threonylcarbamoyladenosine biosynthesis protein TsaE|tara:strand:- start:1121 stop:1567 length:447 start_codon:yes stop_codon:yes gene_type:complete
MRIATKSSIINVSTEKKLRQFANNLSKKLKQGDTFFLFGEMGVGKTTLVKYLINNLQIQCNQNITEVTSPTFNIMNEYKIDDLLIKHYDLYRLKSPDELKGLNLFDESEKSVLLIEWPQIIKKEPNSVIKLYFEYKNDYQDRFINVIN